MNIIFHLMRVHRIEYLKIGINCLESGPVRKFFFRKKRNWTCGWKNEFQRNSRTHIQKGRISRWVKLPDPLDGKSLSKEGNAKDDAEVREVAKTPFRAIIGMLSYIAVHTKPDIAYALNVLSRYCCSAMHPFRPTIPPIRICGIVRRSGCIALHYYVHFFTYFLFRHSWDREWG